MEIEQNQVNQGQPDNNQNPNAIILERTDFHVTNAKATKFELLLILEVEYGYFVPGGRMCRICFVRGVLDGTKALIKKDRIVPLLGFEHFPELSIQRLIEFGDLNVPDFHRYLPDDRNQAYIERKYLMVLLNSLVPNSIENIRRNAIRRSRAGLDEEDHNGQIRLTQEFRDLFTNYSLSGNRLLSSLQQPRNDQA